MLPNRRLTAARIVQKKKQKEDSRDAMALPSEPAAGTVACGAESAPTMKTQRLWPMWSIVKVKVERNTPSKDLGSLWVLNMFTKQLTLIGALTNIFHVFRAPIILDSLT